MRILWRNVYVEVTHAPVCLYQELRDVDTDSHPVVSCLALPSIHRLYYKSAPRMSTASILRMSAPMNQSCVVYWL